MMNKLTNKIILNFKKLIISNLLFLIVAPVFSSYPADINPYTAKEEGRVLAKNEIDLTNRLPGEYGSRIFADNILLALHYKKGDIKSSKINWEEVRKPFSLSFELKPNEVFSFHKNTLGEFKEEVSQTMNSRFITDEGYLSLNGLGGNGVCHLASLINWTASEAGLEVIAKVDHNFYAIPGIPKKYGTSILYAEKGGNSQNQNLYIKNNRENNVKFNFEAKDNKVILTIEKGERFPLL